MSPILSAARRKARAIPGFLRTKVSAAAARAEEMMEAKQEKAAAATHFMYAETKLASDLPEPVPIGDRKPFPTPVNVLIRKARRERILNQQLQQRQLDPPENGLLIPKLIPLSHEVFQSTIAVRQGLARLVAAMPVLKCKFCPEVHIGRFGHELRTCKGPESGRRSALHVWETGFLDHVFPIVKCYHIYDRVGNPRVTHDERLIIPRIPAVVELCIQAGLDLEACPTRRRNKPIYMVGGQITDFEPVYPHNIHELLSSGSFEIKELELGTVYPFSSEDEIKETADKTLEAWLKMREGAKALMNRYPVHTCGYCPEIQVGPKGHKVRACRAPKHQFRDGQHAWQEATIEDLIPPVYVWHSRDINGPPLVNDLRKFYGKAPAVVEMCVHAGATVPEAYGPMMRLDVVVPALEEADIVA